MRTRRPAGARQVGRRVVHRPQPWRRKRLGWLGRGIAVCALAIAGVVAWAAIARALAPKANTSLEHFDALIVLGYPADADGNPSPTQLARVTEAVHEYERGVAPRIIVTGGAAHNQFVEAHVMAETAEAQGIPEAMIVEEPQAMNTVENACYSMKIMRSHGWDSAEVVSSASHLPRAALILSRLPLKWRVHAAPALEPGSTGATAFVTMIEILKTVHYLVWSRQMDPCTL
jgi:uncharacterized SAM-binding protein YcdF (DUF218 family)